MNVTIDGQPVACREGESLLDILARAGVRLDGLRVTVNGEPAPVGALVSYRLAAGDEVAVDTCAHLRRAESVTGAVGATPLVRLRRLPDADGAAVWAKLEACNPAGSVKDRIGVAMIEAAEQAGEIRPGRTTIIEATSGNTGIGLAMAAAAKGYRLIVTMPENMTRERVELLRLYGAEVVLTPADEGMAGAVRRAEQLAAEIPDAYLTRQFDNPANPDAHFRTTGPEIWRALAGRIDAFVAGVGTGGTLTGVARYLKSQRPSVRVVAVEPARSPVLSGGEPGPHGIPGIGAGFIPSILDRSVIDDVVAVDDADAVVTARRLASEEGISAGISSGAAVWAAMQMAREMAPAANVVAILPDDALKYMSTFVT